MQNTVYIGINKICTLLLALTILPTAFATSSPSEQDEIRQRVALIRNGDALNIQGAQIASAIVLPALYERRDYVPIWTNPLATKQMIDILETIDSDGLDSRDYHLSALQAQLKELEKHSDPVRRAEVDLLLSDSLIRLGYHLQAGKVDPENLDANWNMNHTIGDLDNVLAMSSAIEAATLPQLIDILRPSQQTYAAFKRALEKYRQIEAQGGWPQVAAGPTLKPGMNSERVDELRQRLLATGELQDQTASTHFDTSLEEAVKRFQQRHGISTDGIVGPGTLATMNVTVAARIDQIRVNLERARWVFQDLPDTFVLTDIAGYKVSLFRNGKLAWSTRAQVGKPYRKTPIFRDTIRYLEVNPTWTVPPTILKKDILPKIKQDPDYLNKKDMQVLTFSGDPVDPGSIDWSLYPGKTFPYMIRQRPGPKNALGRVKFMFPNKHAVYLHDTPSQSLFDRDARAFSSGCIRVQDPFEFAELLLDQPGWDKNRLLEVVESRKTTRVNLQTPVAVLLLYWTVDTDADGGVTFKPDIYNRDPAILEALNSPFRFRTSPIVASP